MPDKPAIITTDALDEGEVSEYDTFDEAYAALMASLPDGGALVLHEETCALVDDEEQCDCVPLRITKGATA